MPPTADSPCTSILQITDTHLFPTAQSRLLNVDTTHSLDGVLAHIQAHEQTADLVLVTGDIAQEPGPTPYRYALDQLRPFGRLLCGLPGNHDDGQVLRDIWGAHTQPITDLGAWRLVMLDSVIPGSNAGHLHGSQLDLLAQACADAPEQHILVAMHHNPIPMGSAWLDPMMINNSPALFAVVQQCPQIRALVWGHVHQAFDSVCSLTHSAHAQDAPRTLRLLSSPATSVQFAPHSQTFTLDLRDPGYRRLRLYDNGTLETEVVRVPGLNLAPALDSAGY